MTSETTADVLTFVHWQCSYETAFPSNNQAHIEWMSQLMPGEFLPQFLRLEKADRTSSQWRTIYHPTTSVWKMPPSWHWTGHFGGNWQQAEPCTEMEQAEQWWWWWWY